MTEYVVFSYMSGRFVRSLAIHRTRRPDMTEKLLTGTLSLNTTNQSPHATCFKFTGFY